MARTGNFGRLPRAMPSLQNTLLAIAREQQNTDDQNLMSAWEKGGLWHGQKVTDSFMLNYWKKRVSGVSKDDPLYDTYRNAVMQYEYQIAESKKTAAFALIAKPTAGQYMDMYNFYMNWGKKIPKDSEFYRVLQRDAGQYLRDAKAKQAAVTMQSEEDKYRSQMGNIESKWEHAGQLALRYVTMLAQEGAGGRDAVLGEQPLGGEGNILNTTNISDLGILGVDTIQSLISKVNVHGGVTVGPDGQKRRDPNAVGGNPTVLFTDENGQPVTGNDILAAMGKADSSFNGRFDLDSIGKVLNNQREGLQKRIALARRTGHLSDAQSLSVEMAKNNEYTREINSYPVLSEYSDLKRNEAQIIADFKAGRLSPDAASQALQDNRLAIGGLANDKRIATDGHLQSQFRAEAAGTEGAVTAWDDMQGTANGYQSTEGGQQGDIPSVNAIIDNLATATEEVHARAKVWTKGDYKDGVFTADPAGTSIGAAPYDIVRNIDNGGAGEPVLMMTSNGSGGLIPTYVIPMPVRVDPGPNVQLGGSDVIASVIQIGGQTMFSAPGGGPPWSTDPQGWDPAKVKSGFDGSGQFIINMASITDKLTPDTLPAGYAPVESGGRVKIVMDSATQAAQLTAPERHAAGFDANTDSWSPTLTGLLAQPDGKKLIAKYSTDTTFQTVLHSEAAAAAGGRWDATTNTMVGGDQNLLTQVLGNMDTSVNAAKNGQNPVDALRAASDQKTAWEKGLIKAQALTQGHWETTGTASGAAGHAPGARWVAPVLPADEIRNNGDGTFSALVNVKPDLIRRVGGPNAAAIAASNQPTQKTIYTGSLLKLPTFTPPVPINQSGSPDERGTPGTPSTSMSGSGYTSTSLVPPTPPPPKPRPSPRHSSGGPSYGNSGQQEY